MEQTRKYPCGEVFAAGVDKGTAFELKCGDPAPRDDAPDYKHLCNACINAKALAEEGSVPQADTTVSLADSVDSPRDRQK